MTFYILQENGKRILQENGIFGILLEGSGATEFKIVNNIIVDPDRETAILAIYDALAGAEFFPFSADTNGFGYFEVGDRIILKDTADNEYRAIVLSVELTLDGGALKEVISAIMPPQTSTNYNYAGVVGQAIKKTEIIVNKQEGYIESLVEETNGLSSQITQTAETITAQVQALSDRADANDNAVGELQEQVTTVEQTAADLIIQVNGKGGANLLKNSVGLKGDIKDYQIYDVDGNLVDADNAGTILQTTDVVQNTDSNSAIELIEQYILQTTSTIVGQRYTIFFRYNSNDDCDLLITGQSPITIPASADWATFKFSFVASVNSTTVRLDNTAYPSSNIVLSDLVFKIGDADGWQQAPNEVYGKDFRFDKDGFRVSSEDSTFATLLDNRSLSAFDTAGGSDKIMMYVDILGALLTNVKIQDYLMLQRYGNPEKAVRIIPTSTGAMVAVNN